MSEASTANATTAQSTAIAAKGRPAFVALASFSLIVWGFIGSFLPVDV